MSTNLSNIKALGIVAGIYLIALFWAFQVLNVNMHVHPIIQMGCADLCATVIVFVSSYYFKNSSMYDPYWSVFPLFGVFYWWIDSGDSGNEFRNIIIVLLVVVWGIRLTLNWVRGWKGMGHQDWRYTRLEEEYGRFYWIVSFLGIHLFPTVVVFLGLIPVFYILQDPSPLSIIDILAASITMFAIAYEAIADSQLRTFRRKSSGLITRGLWSWSRHPNYFGEILFWIGLLLFLKDPVSIENYWKMTGAVCMILLFNVISVPMMERRLINKEGYVEYKRTVSKIIPLPPLKWDRSKKIAGN